MEYSFLACYIDCIRVAATTLTLPHQGLYRTEMGEGNQLQRCERLIFIPSIRQDFSLKNLNLN
jgi:hypothetical protein